MEKYTAGIARSDITPTKAMTMDGFYAREGLSQGIHDALSLTALAITSGEETVVVVAADLLGFPPRVASALKRDLGTATGLEEERFFLVASHTHSGPALGNLLFLNADPDYLDWLSMKAVEAVAEALRARRPVDVFIGSAKAAAGVNRRLVDKETGFVLMEDNPEGPLDEEVFGLRLVDETGKTLGGLVHVGCHPTAVLHDGQLFSRDYPGYVVDEIEKADPGSTFLFLSGAHANVRPRGNAYRSGQSLAKECGESIAADFRGINWEKVASASSITISTQRLDVELQELPELSVLVDLEQQCQQAIACDPAWLDNLWNKCTLAWVEKALDLRKKKQHPAPVGVGLQVVTLSNTISLVGLPFEVFAQTAKGIKESFDRPGTVVVCGYFDGLVGYLPPEEDQVQGGYEATEAFKVYGYPSPFALGSEALIRRKVEDLIRKSRR